MGLHVRGVIKNFCEGLRRADGNRIYGGAKLWMPKHIGVWVRVSAK